MSVLNALIRSRKILAAGHGNVPDYQDGTKVIIIIIIFAVL